MSQIFRRSVRPLAAPITGPLTGPITAGVALLLAALLLAGCSDDGESGDAKAATPAAVDTLVQAGIDQVDAGAHDEAQGTFASVLRLDADNQYAHYNLGVIAQQTGRDAEAIESYDAALKIDPDFTSALYNRAMLAETSDLDAAVDLYRRAVAADPKLARAHLRLGFALQHQDEIEEAEKHLGIALELDPALAKVGAPTYN